jgi:eukaryotic-like serine/threonine-protein kinase
MDIAATLADRAVALAEADPQAGELLARCLVRRSGLALQIGRLETATSDAARAVTNEIERIEPGARSWHVGRAYLALGRALSAQGKPDDARAAMASALEHLEPTLGEDHAETRRARQLQSEKSPRAVSP